MTLMGNRNSDRPFLSFVRLINGANQQWEGAFNVYWSPNGFGERRTRIGVAAIPGTRAFEKATAAILRVNSATEAQNRGYFEKITFLPNDDGRNVVGGLRDQVARGVSVYVGNNETAANNVGEEFFQRVEKGFPAPLGQTVARAVAERVNSYREFRERGKMITIGEGGTVTLKDVPSGVEKKQFIR